MAWVEVSSENARREFGKRFIQGFSPRYNTNFIVKPPVQSFFVSSGEIEAKDLLTVAELAKELKIGVRRVHVLISEVRLPAEKLGSYYVIKKANLGLVKYRPTGRPPKAKVSDKGKLEKWFVSRILLIAFN